jgi:hypothetical protein
MQNLKPLSQVMEVHGVRVLTTRQIASMYGTEPEIINNNYLRNKSKYVQEKHFISVSGEEMRSLRTSHQFDGELKRVSRAYFWTEKGALLHAKSLNTDKAWEVYDYLVDFYFRAKEKEEPRKPIVPVTDMTKPLKNEMSIKNSIPEDKTRQAGYDIAPAFRELISLLPVEALDAMEKCFRDEKSRVVKLAAIGVLAEKMKRQLA